MVSKPFNLSVRGEYLTLVVCVALSLTMLFLPGDTRIRVADRLGIVHLRLSTRPDLVGGSSSTGIDGPLAGAALIPPVREHDEPIIQPGKLTLRYKLFR